MDESFRKIIQALEHKQLLNNTIIVFLSDNGASVPANGDFVHGHNFGSNWPLRHGKGSLFRSPAFIWSKTLPRRGFVYNGLFHVSDWLPTLSEAVGSRLTNSELRDISGVSHWNALLKGPSEGPRSEVVNNIDTLGNSYSITMKSSFGLLYKLIGGNVMDNTFLGWYPTEGTSEEHSMTETSPLAVQCFDREFHSELGMELLPCVPKEADCLFELTSDPCEQNNIAQLRPDLVKVLRGKLSVYNRTSILAANKPYDPKSNPDLYGGLWVPWLDEHEIMDKEPMSFDDHFLVSQCKDD